MAVDFPTSPSNGQTFTSGTITYTYNATAGLWNSAASGGGGSSVTVSDTAPTSPSDGDQWYNSLDLNLYVYYNDGTSSQWVQSAPQQAGVAGADSTVAGPAGPAGGDGRAGVYADMAALIAKTGMVAGDQALVTALNKVFMYTGTAWYLVATMTNASPTAITGVSGSYDLATDGTATTITAVSTDPEGFALTWSYAVTTGSLGSTATVSQADNVFTITPSSTPADAGSFSITFSVTDGATGAVNAVSAFTLAFSVTNSRYTALSVKATATGSNQTFDDASTSNHTITVAGNSTASTYSPHRHGGYSANATDNAPYSEASHGASVYFDGSGDYLSFPDSVDWDFGTGDFTVEGWVNPAPDLAADTQFIGFGDGGNGGGNFGFEGTGQPYVYHNGYFARTSTALTLGSWSHIAFVRSSGTLSCYINGTSQASSSYTGNVGGTMAPRIGAYSGGQYFKGHMSDVRVVKGTAVYTSNFTLPTAPLTAVTNTKFLLNPETSISDLSQNHTLTCYGNVATDATTVKFAGTKSIAFNGTGDYLIFSNGTPSTTDLTFDEEFTIEFWAYLNATNVTTIFYSCGGGTANWSATTGNESSIFIYNGSLYHQSSQGGSFHSDNISIPSVVQTGEWQHWAVTCDANADCKWYLNGTLMWSYAHVFPTKKTGTIWRAVIGAGQYLTDDNLDGYIQDFRITKGLVRYTANFTPPTAELEG